jgi:hypothetical protein
MTLPSMAMNQIAELLALILDRISNVPSPWLEALTPLLTWLTLHRNDPLVSNLFQASPTLKSDLARIHKILANYCNQEFRSKGDKINQEDEEE